MQIDFTKDLIIIGTWALPLSTFGIWISALLGFALNLIYNRRLYWKKYKDKKIVEIAEDVFLQLEEISHLTPMKSDDKLFEFLRLSITAFYKTFNRHPTTNEVVKLRQHAERLAKKDKVLRLSKKKFAQEMKSNG